MSVFDSIPTRITDEQVAHSLQWARNYGDVESWERVAARGAKWLVVLSRQHTISGMREIGGWIGARPIDLVPREIVLSNREVLVLCYGLAIGGERPEPREKQRDAWGWNDSDEPTSEQKEIEP
jgi:hypothetical protein